MSLEKLKKAELIQMVKILESNHDKLVDDYNLLLHFLEKEETDNKTSMDSQGLFVQEIMKASKFKKPVNTPEAIDQLVKHIKKCDKRWK
ncbi:hypothetical protein [Vibrio splendidus]|uniref:hypothetical protein n=1 Tax=Vibrio splendidus TaxID=29497 RepID=UPI000E0983AA|nr:hypothetical protein [Vibrio splendidus]